MRNELDFRIHEQHWHTASRWIISVEGASVQLDIFPEPIHDGIKALIWALWVDPGYRRKGLAKALLQKAEEIAKALNEPFVWLEWDSHDTGRDILQWYLRSGYNDIAFSNTKVLLKKEL